MAQRCPCQCCDDIAQGTVCEDMPDRSHHSRRRDVDLSLQGSGETSFACERVEYGRRVTVDGSQGQESNVVIFRFTKPRTAECAGLGLLCSYQRLNVAMTRAKKLMIVVINMRIWNERFVAIAKSSKTRFLASLLQDAVNKRERSL